MVATRLTRAKKLEVLRRKLADQQYMDKAIGKMATDIMHFMTRQAL